MPKLLCTNLTDRRFERYGLRWPENFDVIHAERSELIPPYSAAVRAIMPDVEFLYINVEDVVPGDLIAGCPKLKLIQSIGAAFHLVDHEKAAECGVMVCNTKGSYTDANKEFFTIRRGPSPR